ncbi:hypothetical protein [Sphingomicrobium marinum]|uniref:hypothetical protein n=1 Tax=Sphingomicrobium marinum TaxID=1227950 RepID=UPI00223F1153|nr:hypothetical protein [Sphingomicrobium marinum]
MTLVTIKSLIIGLSLLTQGPTLEQLLETPSAQEIVDRWGSVCVANAGNLADQKSAVEELGLEWPYIVRIEEDENIRACSVSAVIESPEAYAELLLITWRENRLGTLMVVSESENRIVMYAVRDGRHFLVSVELDYLDIRPVGSVTLAERIESK